MTANYNTGRLTRYIAIKSLDQQSFMRDNGFVHNTFRFAGIHRVGTGTETDRYTGPGVTLVTICEPAELVLPFQNCFWIPLFSALSYY